MTSISKTERLAAQLRAALSSRLGKARGPETQGTARSTAQDPPEQRVRVARDLEAAVRAVDLSSLGGLEAGRRAFLQIVLLDEFGIFLSNDPRFLQLVQKVNDAIEEEPALREELDRLILEIASP